METSNFSVLLIILFFVLLIGYKLYSKQSIQVFDLLKCTLAAMVLPNLVIYLFYLITNPQKAIEMTETTQYLTFAALIITYIAIEEIRQTFKKGPDSS